MLNDAPVVAREVPITLMSFLTDRLFYSAFLKMLNLPPFSYRSQLNISLLLPSLKTFPLGSISTVLLRYLTIKGDHDVPFDDVPFIILKRYLSRDATICQVSWTR